MLLVLSLVYLLYVPRANFSTGLEWAAAASFSPECQPSRAGSSYTWASDDRASPPGTSSHDWRALIAAALVTLAVGLIQTA